MNFLDDLLSSTDHDNNSKDISGNRSMKRCLSSFDLLSKIDLEDKSQEVEITSKFVWTEKEFLTISLVSEALKRYQGGRLLLSFLVTASHEVIAKNKSKISNNHAVPPSPVFREESLIPARGLRSTQEESKSQQSIIIALEDLFKDRFLYIFECEENVTSADTAWLLLVTLIKDELCLISDISSDVCKEYTLDDISTEYRFNHVLNIIREHLEVDPKIIMRGMILTRKFISINDRIIDHNCDEDSEIDERDDINFPDFNELEDIYMSCNDIDITFLSVAERCDIRELLGTSKTIFIRLFLFNIINISKKFVDGSLNEYINSIITIYPPETIYEEFDDPILVQIIMISCGKYYMDKFSDEC